MELQVKSMEELKIVFLLLVPVIISMTQPYRFNLKVRVDLINKCLAID